MTFYFGDLDKLLDETPMVPRDFFKAAPSSSDAAADRQDPEWLSKTMDFCLSGFEIPKNDLNVLSIGCGEHGLIEYLALKRSASVKGKAIRYTAVELSQRYASQTIDMMRDIRDSRIVIGDARMLSELLGEERYDLVLSRHPDCELAGRRSVWSEIFSKSRSLMADGSAAVVTGFNENNHFTSANILYDCGFGISYHGPNRFPGPVVCGCGRLDKYVTVASKGN